MKISVFLNIYSEKRLQEKPQTEAIASVRGFFIIFQSISSTYWLQLRENQVIDS